MRRYRIVAEFSRPDSTVTALVCRQYAAARRDVQMYNTEHTKV